MRRSIHPRRCTLLVVLAAAGGCSLEGNSLPDEYLGQWYYTGSSGGIAGDGMGDEPSGWIVINADNTIDRFDDDGTLLGTDAFNLVELLDPALDLCGLGRLVTESLNEALGLGDLTVLAFPGFFHLFQAGLALVQEGGVIPGVGDQVAAFYGENRLAQLIQQGAVMRD